MTFYYGMMTTIPKNVSAFIIFPKPNKINLFIILLLPFFTVLADIIFLLLLVFIIDLLSFTYTTI